MLVARHGFLLYLLSCERFLPFIYSAFRESVLKGKCFHGLPFVLFPGQFLSFLDRVLLFVF